MRSQKRTKFFSLGRKWFFTLALFLLVFAAASIIRVRAGNEHSVTGWFGGWSEDGTGSFTGVGWISMNSTNCDANNDGLSEGTLAGCPALGTAIPNYGVNVPSGDGPITGINNYAWSPNVGWVSFNLGDLSGCPSGTCNARREGDSLKGWARILGIKTEFEKIPSNSGGWEGWIKLSSELGDPFSYGVKINGDGTFADCNPSSNGIGCAWSGEDKIAGIPQGLGWFDFAKARLPMPIDGLCNTPPNSDFICPGDPKPTTMNNDQLCADYDLSDPPSVTGTWDWTCSGQNGGDPMDCHAELDSPVVPKCGSDVNFCTGNTSSPCASGSPSAFVNEEGYEVSWTCTGSCPATVIDCSAKGKKSCGWIETN